MGGQFYGVDLILPALDKTLCEDLDTIYDAYSGLHGPFKAEWRGKVAPARVEESAMPPAAFERLVFFSGGVDAAHAAINDAGHKNVLASVPSVEEAWNANKKRPNAGKDFLELKSRLIRDFSEATKTPWGLCCIGSKE